VGWLGDDGLLTAAVGDADRVGGALLALDDACLAVEPGVVATVGDAGIDREVDAVAVLELLDGSLGR
jgi:hypothetical protein